MERTLAFKLATMGLLVAFLAIALSTIGHLIPERQARRNEVIQDIARSSSGEQQITGPLLVIPYKKTVRQWRENDHGELHVEEREVSGQLYFAPEHFELDGSVRTEPRARGIYEARLYHANLAIKADFEVPLHYGVGSDTGAYQFEPPFVALGVTDVRGIGSPLTATLDAASVKLLPGSGTGLLSGGLHLAAPGVAPGGASHLRLALNLPLLGTSQFHVVPVGRETQVRLQSNWPHPSFTGDFLPVQRTLDANGFTAQWSTTFFATDLEEALHRCDASASCADFTSQRLGVSFVDPVDQYLKTDRAIKYALLFVALTFAGFFLFDVLRKLPVHPVQYGLVGASLALFYLLLLSLSEHVGFALAYLLSSTACVSLIAFYASYVLRSVLRGFAFGCGLALLYGCLYGLLGADDYALVMGSLLLFAVLAAVMILTRNVNWSTIAAKEAPAL